MKTLVSTCPPFLLIVVVTVFTSTVITTVSASKRTIGIIMVVIFMVIGLLVIIITVIIPPLAFEIMIVLERIELHLIMMRVYMMALNFLHLKKRESHSFAAHEFIYSIKQH